MSTDQPSLTRRFIGHVAHPMEWLRGVCGGESAFPLVVLFGLNAVDELDRTAFAILLPNIRDHFNLDNTKVLSLVALASVASLALQVPIAQFADRSKRVPLAIGGAMVWAFFSGMTGLATGVVILTIARSGSSIGKAVIDPTHNSLLADYYPIETRSKVFSTHRAANAIGAFVGPLVAGLLAYSFDWRVPFIVFVVPRVGGASVVSPMKRSRQLPSTHTAKAQSLLLPHRSAAAPHPALTTTAVPRMMVTNRVVFRTSPLSVDDRA